MTMSRSLAVKLTVSSMLLLVLGLGVAKRNSIPALIAALQKQEDPLGRFEAAHALGDLGAEARPAVPALIEMLRSNDHKTAEIGAFVLARIAPDPAVGAAVPMLIETVRSRDKGWVARYNAAVVLRKLGREQEELFTILRDKTSLSFMIPLLEGGKPLNRLHVCEALMLSGPPRRDFLNLFRRATEDPDARVRDAALKALRAVGAAEHVATPDEAPKALASLPPEPAEAGQVLIESQRALQTGDIDTFRKHLTRAGREEFDRDPRANFASAQSYRLKGLRLLGGILEDDTATIDIFTDGGVFSDGSVTLIREDGRWVYHSTSTGSGIYIDESSPLGLREVAARALLEAIAAGQRYHWLKTSPGTYADSLTKLDLTHIQPPGYVVTLTAGAKSNGIYHAWSAEAHPVGYPETGIHSFYADERGVLLKSDTRGLPLALEMPEH
jgi:HEAT repeat protein